MSADDIVDLFNDFPELEEWYHMVKKKAQDYNDGMITRADYFPFGQLSYTQMIHTKALRLVSLTQQGMANKTQPNFEGIHDTLMDIISYALFNLQSLRNE